MREVERIDRILGLVKDIWMKHPDVRYMQLKEALAYSYSDRNDDCGKQYYYEKYEFDKGNIVQFKKNLTGVDLFHLEDDKFETFLEDYLKELNE